VERRREITTSVDAAAVFHIVFVTNVVFTAEMVVVLIAIAVAVAVAAVVAVAGDGRRMTVLSCYSPSGVRRPIAGATTLCKRGHQRQARTEREATYLKEASKTRVLPSRKRKTQVTLREQERCGTPNQNQNNITHLFRCPRWVGAPSDHQCSPCWVASVEGSASESENGHLEGVKSPTKM
jgi:hypothetical protein